MRWQEAKHELEGGAKVQVEHGGFGSHPGQWSEVYHIKGPIGFGSSAIMIQLARSSGYITVPRSAKYRVVGKSNPSTLLPLSWKKAQVRRLPNGQVQIKMAGTRQNPSAGKIKRKCQCGDPGCPIHKGTSHCPNAARMKVHRSDMEDRGGTWMCPGCAEDALNSGVFY